ncbi:MAG: hypothetical protein SGPRY_004513, partial [Prymnesium sp.]
MGTPTPQDLPKPSIVSQVLSLEISYQGVQLPASTFPTEQHVFALPEGKPLPWLFKCIKDDDCAGPPHMQPPVGGSCRDGRCICPPPWSGGRCDKRLECTWYSEASGWGETACVYEPPLECRCNVSGSFDVLVVEEAQLPLKAPQVFVISPFDLPGDLVYLTGLWSHPHAAIFLFSIDAAWLVLVLLACMRSNEAKMRQNAQYYQKWREVHRERQIARGLSNQSRSRLEAMKAFVSRTWLLLKSQHKLIRIFFLTFDIGEDPSNRLSGAQKATVLVCIILLRLVVLSLQYNPASLEEYQKRSTAEQWLSNLVVGSFAVAVTIPGTVILDRMFMRAQKVANAVLNSNGQPIIGTLGKAGIRLFLESSDTRWVLLRWQMVVDQLKVAWLEHEMMNMRIARVCGARGIQMSSRDVFQHFHLKQLQQRANDGGTLLCTPRSLGQKKQRGSYSSFTAQRSEFAVSGATWRSRLPKEGPPSARAMLPLPDVLPAPDNSLRQLLEAMQEASTIERRPVPQMLSEQTAEQQTGRPRDVQRSGVVRTGKWCRLLVRRAHGLGRMKIDPQQNGESACEPSHISQRELTTPSPPLPLARRRESPLQRSLSQLSSTSASRSYVPDPSSCPHVVSLKKSAYTLKSKWKSPMLSASFFELRLLQSTLRDWYNTCAFGSDASLVADRLSAKMIGHEADHGNRSLGGGLVTRMKRSRYFKWFFAMLHMRAFQILFPW